MSTWSDLARNVLTMDEGLRYSPYKDTKGNWTIGVGHYIGLNLEDLKLSWAVIQLMLKEQIEKALEDCYMVFGDAFDSYATPRQMALLSMMFNLGRPKFEQFHQMIAAVKDNDWTGAALEATRSKWAHDVNPGDDPAGRDSRVAYMLTTGRLHPYYEDLDS